MKKARLALVAIMAMAAFGLVSPQSSQAAASIICNGAGRLEATPQPDGTAVWTVSGGGRCLEPLTPNSQPRILTFAGTGTSTGLGLCSPGGLLVTNLQIVVDVHMFKTGDLGFDSEQEVWSAPVTLFPLATPFLVNGLAGAGLSTHRIFLNCGNENPKPAATFDFVRLL